MRPRTWAGFGMILTAFVLAGPLPPAGAAPPFKLPRDRATWEARRGEIRATVWKALGNLPARPPAPQMVLTDPVPRDGVFVSSFQIDNGIGTPLRGVLAYPRSDHSDRRQPAVIFLVDGDPMELGPDGLPIPISLAHRGFLTLCRDTRSSTGPTTSGKGNGNGNSKGRLAPWVEPGSDPDAAERGPSTWGLILRDDLICLDALLHRPETDPQRIALGGFGTGGTRAWWLMALDERIPFASAASGMTRFENWEAARELSDPALAPWVGRLRESFDTEAILALVAPRSFEFLVGTRDPSSPLPGVLVLRDTVRRAYGLYKPAGHHMEAIFAGLGSEFTLLEWDMMLEHFDKSLMPQGPTPLGHAPEPEPTVDDRFLDLAAHGLAGWVPEMSQRSTTWRWENGTIVCDPGKNEYGWLRAPIETDDFILSVEWKVPKAGNTGIFLRAQPVEWFVYPTPTDLGKWEVAARGPSWPSRTGLELQAQDDPGQANKYSSGSLYRHAAPAENVIRPAGEWNRYTVRCRGPRVEVWCNGRQVLDTRIDRYPTLRQPPMSGYFGLQNHGVGAEFRNIRYLRLTGDPGTGEAATR